MLFLKHSGGQAVAIVARPNSNLALSEHRTGIEIGRDYMNRAAAIFVTRGDGATMRVQSLVER